MFTGIWQKLREDNHRSPAPHLSVCRKWEADGRSSARACYAFSGFLELGRRQQIYQKDKASSLACKSVRSRMLLTFADPTCICP